MSRRLLSYGQFFGKTVNRRVLPGIFLSSLLHQGPTRYPKHAHEQALFCLSLQGVYSEQYGSRKITYVPGTTVFHPSGEEHVTEIHEGGGHIFAIEIGPEWIKRLDDYSCEPYPMTDLYRGEMSWHAKRMFDACNDKGIANEMLIEGLVLELLSCLIKEKGKQTGVPGWLPKVVELLKNDFQHTHTIKWIAEEFGIHPVQLSRIFRRFMHQSIAEYVTKLRVEFACQLLRCTSKELREVAMEAGFADQSHLTRIFKRFVGTTPATYRHVTRGAQRIQSVP